MKFEIKKGLLEVCSFQKQVDIWFTISTEKERRIVFSIFVDNNGICVNMEIFQATLYFPGSNWKLYHNGERIE